MNAFGAAAQEADHSGKVFVFSSWLGPIIAGDAERQGSLESHVLAAVSQCIISISALTSCHGDILRLLT
jgi:hypothetical protein